jgi:AraC-like DNA-binding protein
MQQAREMLTCTSLSVKEVVSALGLNDRSHFSRMFKSLVGVRVNYEATCLSGGREVPKEVRGKRHKEILFEIRCCG